jgi:hypothetical protein
MPHLGGSAKNAKKPKYKEAKRETYQLVLERLMKSLKECNNNGGFYATRVCH